VRAESARREAAETPPPAVRVPDEHRLADVPQRAARSPLSDSAPLRIVRGGDRLRIQTRGALAEIVPALIETLDDSDGSVARAAEQHLEALRAELAGEASFSRHGNRRPRGGVTDDIMQALLTALLFTTLLGACFSPSGSVSTSSTFLLAERTSEDGMRTMFRVHSDRQAGPSIARVDTRSLQAAFLRIRPLARSLLRPGAGARALLEFELSQESACTSVTSSSSEDHSRASAEGARAR
jgi:hypothetical protein